MRVHKPLLQIDCGCAMCRRCAVQVIGCPLTEDRTRNSFAAVLIRSRASQNTAIYRRFSSVQAFFIRFAPGSSHCVR